MLWHTQTQKQLLRQFVHYKIRILRETQLACGNILLLRRIIANVTRYSRKLKKNLAIDRSASSADKNISASHLSNVLLVYRIGLILQHRGRSVAAATSVMMDEDILAVDEAGN